MILKYTTLLLDADGTFLDFKRTEKQALIHTFEKHHLVLTPEIKAHYDEVNHGLWKQFELGLIDKKTVVYTRFVQLFKDLNIDEDGIAFEDEYQETLSRFGYLLPEADEVLQRLSQHFQLYVVTNGVSHTQHTRLNDTGAVQYFKDVFVSEDIGYQKPMREYFEYCFDHMENFELEKTLMVGDSLTSDIQGGLNMGMDTCWIHDEHQHNPGLPITYEVKNLKELETLLLG